MSPSSARMQLSSKDGNWKIMSDIDHFLTSPNCQTGHSQSHVTILKRPGDRETSHDQPQCLVSSLKYYVSLIFSASFLSAPNVTPIIAGKRPHFQKNRNPFEFIPIPSSTLDPLLFLNEH